MQRLCRTERGRGRKVETDLFSSPPAGGRRAEPASLNGGSSMPQLPGGPPGRRGPVQCAFHHQTRQMLDLLVAWGAKTGRKLQVQTPNTNCLQAGRRSRQSVAEELSPLGVRLWGRPVGWIPVQGFRRSPRDVAVSTAGKVYQGGMVNCFPKQKGEDYFLWIVRKRFHFLLVTFFRLHRRRSSGRLLKATNETWVQLPRRLSLTKQSFQLSHLLARQTRHVSKILWNAHGPLIIL